jgi:hypothetical protein
MTRSLRAWGSFALLSLCVAASQAAAADPAAIVDKAIEAAGGKENLGKFKAVSWKVKGKFTFEGTETPFDAGTTAEGLDKMRGEFKGEFGGMPIEAVTVLAGDKGWRKFGGVVMEIDAAGIANEKRALQQQLIPALLLPLKDPQFKLAEAGEEKVGDATADGIRVTGSDGKDFTIYFSRETGLPVKMKAKIADFTGTEFEQETLYSDYAEMNGIQKAKKIVSLRDGQPFIQQEIVEYQPLEAAPEGPFSAP